MKTFYAVFIGINAYTNCRQLNGCTNDVVAMNRFFEKLSDQQVTEEGQAKIEWKPKFLLLPHEEEKALLEQNHITYEEPTRDNVIKAFEHFKDADPAQGDYCMIYYSGHGSYIDAPDIFLDYEKEGTLQTWVCSDSRNKDGRDLLDKEIGYLIADTLEGKNADDSKPGVHFLLISDSCHSGTISRSDSPATARMEKRGSSVEAVNQILGFSRQGNVFYKKMEEGQARISPDGLNHARYINLSASKDAEVAQEKILHSYIEAAANKRRQHGVFSYSFLKTLERSGTDISYAELMNRIGMEVRQLVSKQTPVLGRTNAADEDMFFLRQEFKPLQASFEIGFRETILEDEWYLNAGGINGIVAPKEGKKSLVQLTDGSNRLVEVISVGGLESILDSSQFTEEDKGKNLSAIIHSMPFERTLIAYGEELTQAEKDKMDNRFADEEKPLAYLRKAVDNETPNYVVKPVVDVKEQRKFMLCRPGTEIPICARNSNIINLLLDANHIGQWENTLNLANPDTDISRSDITVKARKMEGVDYPSLIRREKAWEIGQKLLDRQFGETMEDPEAIHLHYKKLNGKFVQPALSVEIEINSDFNNYYVGSMYLDSRFGVDIENMDVTQLSKDGTAGVSLEYRHQDEQGNYKLPFMPTNFDPFYHEYGISEVVNYLIIVVAKKEFSLKNFQQSILPLDDKRSMGLELSAEKEDDWFTIKIPIHMSWPIESKKLVGGKEIHISRTYAGHGDYKTTRLRAVSLLIQSPEGFSATATATTQARAKRVVQQLENSRSSFNANALVPAAHLFNQAEGEEAVFTRSMVAEPDQNLSILELTNVKGEINPDKPLVITPGDQIRPEESIVPFAYDEELDLYFPIGFTNPNGEVVIEQLPAPTTQVIGSDAVDEPIDENGRSLTKSIKLFFNKLVWSKLSGEQNYRTLALVEPPKVGEEWTKINYHGTSAAEDQDELEKLKARLEELKAGSGKSEVLMLVHGIIGNTDAQVDAVFEKTKIHEQFAAVLTFDYENLNSPIEDTAKHLLKSLNDIGIAEQQLTILAHSMGGLVTRYMMEKEGGANLVKRLIQAGTPNAGSEISDFRKKVTGWLGLGINGLAFVQPYLPILSFIGKGLEKQMFKTLNQMGPGSSFLTKLNVGSIADANTEYSLLAGNTNLIKAGFEKKDPIWKKLAKAVKNRGAYLFLDYLVFDDDPNDMAVKVESMKVLPVQATIEEVDCDHLSYFTDDRSLEILEKWLTE